MNTTIQSFRFFLDRDLSRLARQIEMYNDEENIWIKDREISNSAGNLALHIVGNLNAFIGAELGNTAYIRDRQVEFTTIFLSRDELVSKINETKSIVDKTLENLPMEDLEKIYPIRVFKDEMTVGFFLIQLCSHLSYHLGQLNYHRRLLDSPNPKKL